MSHSNLNSNRGNRSGFTLIEMLFVISIMGVLASLALLSVRGAREDARAAGTQARIGQVRTLVLQRFEDYLFRKSPVPLSVYVNANNSRLNAKILRQRIIADIINVEMPREFNDLAMYPSQAFRDWVATDPAHSDGSRIFRSAALRTQLISDLASRPPSLFSRISSSAAGGPTEWNLSSEFLHRTLALTDFDGVPGTDLLGRADGDSDRDNLNEVLDSWDEPMSFSIQVRTHDGVPLGDVRDAIRSTELDLEQQHFSFVLTSDRLN